MCGRAGFRYFLVCLKRARVLDGSRGQCLWVDQLQILCKVGEGAIGIDMWTSQLAPFHVAIHERRKWRGRLTCPASFDSGPAGGCSCIPALISETANRR